MCVKAEENERGRHNWPTKIHNRKSWASSATIDFTCSVIQKKKKKKKTLLIVDKTPLAEAGRQQPNPQTHNFHCPAYTPGRNLEFFFLIKKDKILLKNKIYVRITKFID